MQKQEGWGIKGQVEGGLRQNCKIKRVGPLRGGWRVDCEKKVHKKEGWGIKGQIAKKVQN